MWKTLPTKIEAEAFFEKLRQSHDELLITVADSDQSE
jgi:hypothetical protein